MNNINIFLKLKLRAAGEVKGEVGPGDHKDEILIESYKWSLTKVTSSGATGVTGAPGSTREATVPVVHGMEFSMRMNRASPVVMQAAVKADQVIEAVLSCRHANATTKTDFLKITLTDGLITDYMTEASQTDMIPLDQFTIEFRQLAIEHRSVLQGGELGPTVQGQFDIATLRQEGTGGRSPPQGASLKNR